MIQTNPVQTSPVYVFDYADPNYRQLYSQIPGHIVTNQLPFVNQPSILLIPSQYAPQVLASQLHPNLRVVIYG